MTSDADLRQLAQRWDKHDMATVIRRFPHQVRYSIDADLPELPTGGIRSVVVLGMGGSALSGEIVRDTLRDSLRVPLHVCRDYGYGLGVDHTTLVVASSFSGNTGETLEALESLQSQGARVVAIAAGGKLSQTAEDDGFPLVRIPRHLEPDDFQPRNATGYGVILLARILMAAGVLRDVSEQFAGLADFLDALDVRDEAEDVARWIGRRTPVIYTEQVKEASVARIVEIKFHENAKRMALSGAFPEVNHNQMCGFTQPTGKFAVLFMDDPDSHPLIRQRFEVMQRIFLRNGLDHVAFRRWTIPGDLPLRKVFAALVFGDWLTYTRALLDGVDPSPVAVIEEFKRELSEGSRKSQGPLQATS